MLRTARPVLRTSSRAITLGRGPVSPPKAFSTLTSSSNHVLRPQTGAAPRQITLPITWAARYSTKPPPQTEPDKKQEKELGKQKLESDPEHVTTESSVRHALEFSDTTAKEDAKEGAEATKDVSEHTAAGVRQDLRTVKETLALTSVPTESYVLGLAGTLPYLATSLSTIYLGWNLRTQWPTGSNFINSFMVSNETAQQLLQILEPVQLGYGAVILSFLGAIHWGMEYAEKAPSRDRTRFRYGVGVLAPAVAWPTVFMPIQFGLTTQFAAFTLLYFADARATARGWTPHWYGTYRFVLTFIVGIAIFISLVGRAKIGDEGPQMSGARMEQRLHKRGQEEEPYTEKWEKLENEEKERIRREKEEEEKRKKAEKAKAKKDGNGKGKGKGKKADKKDKEGGKDDEAGKDDDSEEDKDDEKDDEKEDKSDGGDDDSDDDDGEDTPDEKDDDADGEDSDEEKGGDDDDDGDDKKSKKGKGKDEKKPEEDDDAKKDGKGDDAKKDGNGNDAKKGGKPEDAKKGGRDDEAQKGGQEQDAKKNPKK